ncbi:hypothetical protein EG68_11843 [Paragonimus skrjabini miyazakii]|uniref:protein-tyrosine-phosphatase n=1 Tax=Paragonimus skrjabini miyazakii TaxID=59628 RepID=A0A8S9YG65_9TREM|nr:hypothetical protein EG68_11843 [Paragonimus skrjabini miyazakii]
MNEILPGLWLGSYPFKDESNLMRVGIKSILTLDLTPLPADIFKTFDKKFIHLIDEPDQDVLDILEDALMFIETSLQKGGVLVHCAMGVSRSATIVIAYVMRKNRVSYDTAFQLVTSKRLVYPNIGFVNQLKLFQVMGWKVVTNSRAYTHYAAMRKFNSSHISVLKVILTPSLQFLTAIHKLTQFSRTPHVCRQLTSVGSAGLFRKLTNLQSRVRHTLFSSADLVHHCLPDRQTVCDYKVAETASDPQGIDSVLIKGITLNEVMVPCTNNELFTDFLEWTRPYTHEVEGKLYCPGCHAKLGSFNWCGEPCVCGTWVTPAFHFNHNHIDRISRHTAGPTSVSSGNDCSTNRSANST